MSAGTLTLTNNSDAVTGKGTAFTTELAAGDFIVVTVGGVPYTLPVKSVESDTELALVSVFTGPTQSGAAWSAVPRVALNMVTAALVVQSAEALRGLNYDKQNWQQVFSGDREITVRLPDGTSFSGPSWKSIAVTLSTLDVDYLNQLASQINQDVQLIDADKTTVVNTAERVSTDAQTASAAATGAKSSETKAAQSEINAESYQGLARQYALNPEDVPVMNGDYSAFHYSEKARKSAEESASHNPVESLVKSLNLSDLADRAAAWLNVRPLGSTPLAGDPVNPYDAATKRWVENLVGAGGGTGPTMNGVQNYGVGEKTLWDSRAFIPQWAVPADGQLLNRADWPELWAHAQMHTPISDSYWLSSPNDRGKWSSGDGTTTFRAPDLNGVQDGSIKGLFGRGDGGGVYPTGRVAENGLPNITGAILNRPTTNSAGNNADLTFNATGAFSLLRPANRATVANVLGVTSVSAYERVEFSASKSDPVYGRQNEVTPNRFSGVWIIRASGGFTAANTSWSVINSDAATPPSGVVVEGGRVTSSYKVGTSEFADASLTVRAAVGGATYARLNIKRAGVPETNYDFVDVGKNLVIQDTATTPIDGRYLITSSVVPVVIPTQNARDYRSIASHAIPGSYPMGVTSGLMTGNQGWRGAEISYVGVINSRNWMDKSAERSCFQIGINDTFAAYRFARLDSATGNYYYSDAIKFRTELNTTVDANGFIKAASPIVKIFRDGSYETNEESEGVAVTHINTGEYLIAGCTGLNADAAWGGIDGGFEIPVDRNKLARIWLDYEVNADGSILVKTYHRTHPEAPEFARNEINGLTNGEPVDIPADSFVSVRVEMPPDSIWNQRQNDALEADVQKPTS